MTPTHEAPQEHWLALDGLLHDLHRVVLESEPHAATPSALTRGLQGASLLGLSLGWGLSVVIASGHYRSASLLALALLLVGVLAVTALGLRSTVLTIREWKTLEAQTIGSVGKNMARWYETVRNIRHTYTAEQIAFARRYLVDVAAQARGRLSLFIGALEKVGIIPLLASTAITLAGFHTDGTVPVAWGTAAAVAGIVYFFALRLVDIAYTLERFALILEQAERHTR
ncbi:hypothetical protein CF68_17275 [Cupriavidus sp. SK-4]|uniref:hypothetical protein n=1 Tax=Cupriavidus sp. SK-4 TaxID=574750 RepID=UPI0004476399|nr:hypothetical protein [Cupriavidus sp. SK-4]EYS82178.1 hypothetical protein CF68_17275 [Cupriavidus sp. SK-4]